MKRLGLCVDDFGLKPEVNEAVVRLAQAGVITVVGCMSTGPAWPEGARRLQGPLRPLLDVGLHLNLTESWPGDRAELVLPLPTVIGRALLGRLPQVALEREVTRQLEAFDRAWGEPPDFVDGHQHVHQLPQVREVLLSCLARRYPGRHPWLRSTVPSPRGRWLFKQQVIAALGARGLRRLATRQGLAMNRALLGVYGFDADAAGYGDRLAQWLDHGADGDLLMLHPAVSPAPSGSTDHPPLEGAVGDGIAAAREVEYEVLSRQGPQLLRQFGVVPVRPSQHPELLSR